MPRRTELPKPLLVWLSRFVFRVFRKILRVSSGYILACDSAVPRCYFLKVRSGGAAFWLAFSDGVWAIAEGCAKGRHKFRE